MIKEILELLRRNWLFFLLTTIVALALRLFFVFHFPHVAGDTFIYGDIAKNWLSHGSYSVSDGATIRPTLIRLPGYPAFLAVVFSIFGREHYTAVMVVQAIIDTNTCLVIAALALELMSARAAKAAYLLAALCPFTAAYVATPLSETLAICSTAHTLYYALRGLKALKLGEPGLLPWFLTGLWGGAGILIRPDNSLVLVPIGLALLVLLLRGAGKRNAIVAGMLLATTSLVPLVPWTARNWRTFHVFQPLSPRYANDPGEFVPMGFNHWVKSWMADSVSVEEVYWQVSGEPIDFQQLPERAFDSRGEYDKTLELITAYNAQLDVDPELDAQFEQLARERVNHNPFRYFVWLPFLRISDMWLRPRTEMLPIESRWWEFSEHEEESAFALLWAGISLLYLLAALRGWWRWRFHPMTPEVGAASGPRRLGLGGVVLIGFVLLRSAFLGSLENPEQRYVLECFPVVLALAGGAFARKPLTLQPRL